MKEKFDAAKYIKQNLTKNEIIVAEYNDIKLDLTRYYRWDDVRIEKAKERVVSIRKSLSKIAKDVNSTAAQIIAERKAREKAIRDHEKELKNISSLIDGLNCENHSARVAIGLFLMDFVRLGVNHLDVITDAHFGNENKVWAESETDYKGYARSCKFAMVRYGYRMTVKKGYRIRNVGNIITFYKGKWNEKGIKCEWMEQGRAYEDCVMKSGFVVRGEHIENAKNLKDAIRINKEHRDAYALKLRLSRAKQAIKGDIVVHFSDSLSSGNCQAGTNNFKHKVEEFLGHEIETLTVAQVRLYGRMFGVESYAERACRYAIANAK